jgi:hypothetical protein
MYFDILMAALSAAFSAVLRWLPENVVRSILFGGQIRPEHKTNFTLRELSDRYKKSIMTFNKALSLNVGFAAIALYAFFMLPPQGKVKVPLIGLEISRMIWINLAPLIAFGLQVIIFTAFLWFMLLRLGQKILIAEIGEEQDFGDITDISLSGPIGHTWLIFRIGGYLESKWNIIWYVPIVLIAICVILSPLLVSTFFVVQLFIMKSYMVATIYVICSVPYFILFFILLGTTAILGLAENAFRASLEAKESLDKRINIIKEQKKIKKKD